MKIFNFKKLAVVISSFGCILMSCDKQASSKSGNTNLVQSDDPTTFIEKEGPVTTFIMRPNPTNGQDTYVSKILKDKSDGNANLNYVHEMAIGTNPGGGGTAVERSYIRFDSLSKIPPTVTIISAKLYLYGESSSIVFPSNGDSYFPGSSNPPNNCLVKRVTGGTWQQSTLTWNTMPGIIDSGDAKLAASTSQWNYNVVVDVTSMVSEMVGTGINYGFRIQLADEASFRTMLFSTSEASDKSLRPRLVVQYQ